MGSSCQRGGSCKTYEQGNTEQVGRKTKVNHFKRLGRTNTVCNNMGIQEDMKNQESDVKVRRPQQLNSVNNGLRGVDFKKIKEAN